MGKPRTHLVVPEGLQANPRHPREATGQPSAYYRSVLDSVASAVGEGDTILLAPANYFGGPIAEHQAGRQYLSTRIPREVRIECPETGDTPYLDTLDNAIELRAHLERLGLWPAGPCTLYCNFPHKLRALLVFKLVGFDIQESVATRTPRFGSRIVSRLWYYDYLFLHYLYEAGAIPYSLVRFTYLSILKK